MRIAREFIIPKDGGWVHALNRISGYPGIYPFQNLLVITEFISRLKYSLSRCCIHCAGFTVMGNHYHLVLLVEKFRILSRRKLERYAKARWGKLWKLRTAMWADQRWEQFNRDLFDLSGFMRDFQSPFATWFNKTFGHRGRLWAGRFTSLAMDHDMRAVQETLLYIELNPVRAKLTTLPELWEAGSAFLRSIGEDNFLIPLEKVFPDLARARVQPFYRGLLLYRGMCPTRAGQAAIPDEVVAREMERGFAPGLYRKRLRFMGAGVMMGTRERILRKLEELTQAGVYTRRRNVTEHLGGLFFTVREQRSNTTW